MRLKPLYVLLTLPLITCLSWTAAHADTIDFTLADPNQTVNLGGTLSFYATVSAPSGNVGSVYLNGDSQNVSGPSSLVLDDTPFFFNFPLFVDPGDSASDLLFTVQVPLATATGEYTGFFSLLGGSDPGAQNLLGSDPFTIQVTSETAVTPEPSTGLLCLSGMLGLALLLQRRLTLNQ